MIQWFNSLTTMPGPLPCGNYTVREQRNISDLMKSVYSDMQLVNKTSLGPLTKFVHLYGKMEIVVP